VEGTFWDGSKCNKGTCPELPEPPENPEGAEWKDPVCDKTCEPSDCLKWDSSKEIKCKVGEVEFKYNCCQPTN
jgi:hypothetical protein